MSREVERRASAEQVLPKMMDQDDVEAFLHTYEVIATWEDWDQTEWAQLLYQPHHTSSTRGSSGAFRSITSKGLRGYSCSIHLEGHQQGATRNGCELQDRKPGVSPKHTER